MRIRERASVIVIHDDRLLAVRLQDPATGRIAVYLPGGALEAGETPADAAVRETLEETGHRVKVDVRSHRTLRYPFNWGGRWYDCTTHFFAAHLQDPAASPARVEDASYNLGAVWIPAADVAATFGYHAGILAEIVALMRRIEGS